MTEKNMDFLLGQALDLTLQEQIESSLRKEKSVSKNNLSQEDLENLVDLIKILPVDLQTILLEKHYFKNPPSSLEKVFDIENPREKYSWTLDLLSQSLGLDDHLIKDSDLDLACLMLINTYTDKLYRIPKTSFDPSKAFRKNMQDLGLKVQGPRRQILKKVAVIFLVLAGSISLFFSINTAARSKVYDWIIKDFGTYSTFSFVQLEETDEEILGLDDLKISYMPDGYELVDTFKSRITRSHYYENTKGDTITIFIKNLSLANNHTEYNTEDAQLEEILVNNHNGYYWERDINFLLWQQNGLEICVFGKINKDELFEIAKNICK
ncbi:DUF4367 domain-containing protein [Neofamilia massiliensis]|uniref:DUF4367 domain-containing protein n=1 Tax=Neofamilia massiliensis TaxID=1673724 RepID=UPI0006BB7DCE|nr:DUF4367 domain-containing protein [Neofamilia massiliensis]